MFAFNTDKDGYPIAGAPTPKYGNIEYQTLCSVCFDMYLTVITGTYWTNLHNAWKSAIDERKKRIQNGGKI